MRLLFLIKRKQVQMKLKNFTRPHLRRDLTFLDGSDCRGACHKLLDTSAVVPALSWSQRWDRLRHLAGQKTKQKQNHICLSYH